MTTESLLSPSMAPAIISDTDHVLRDPQMIVAMTTRDETFDQLEISNSSIVRVRQLAKSDINLDIREDDSPSLSSPPSCGNRLRSNLTTNQYNIVQVKKVNSFANTFDSWVAQQRASKQNVGRRRPHSRAESPVSCNLISVPVYADRPVTCEEEMKDELTKLRCVIFQMHQKLMTEKKLSRRLAEQIKIRDLAFQEVMDRMKTKHEDKLNSLKDKAMVMLSKSAQKKTELEEQNSWNKSTWMAEKNILESKIEELSIEIDKKNKIQLTENKDSKTEITPDTNLSYEFQPNFMTSKDDSISLSIIHSSDCITAAVDHKHSTGWDDLYKILYEISIIKLAALENKRNKTNKDNLDRHLIDYGYFQLFNDVDGHDSLWNSGITKSNFPDNIRSVRRSSSCPYLAEMADNLPPNTEEGHQTTPSEEVVTGVPESISSTDVVKMRDATERFVTPRPMSIPLSIEHRSIPHVDASSGSSSPRDSSPASVFNRQKIQYRHVCRQPKRTLERQEKSLPLPNSASLPPGINVSQMEYCTIPTNNEDHAPLTGKSSIQSNFERLCHRRNGLINPDFKLKQRHTNVMDKLGQNLRQYIGNYNKEGRGGP